MNLPDKILIDKDFTTEEIIDFFVAEMGNVWIMNRSTMIKMKHMKTMHNEYIIQGNKLLGCPIIIVRKPCFMFGVMGV